MVGPARVYESYYGLSLPFLPWWRMEQNAFAATFNGLVNLAQLPVCFSEGRVEERFAWLQRDHLLRTLHCEQLVSKAVG
jgi:hypothetical protein